MTLPPFLRFLLLALALGLPWPAQAASLLNLSPTTAVSGQVGPTMQVRPGAAQWAPGNALVQCTFTYGSGGTSADAWVQTSLDGGTTWTDVANCHFTTSTARFLFNLSALTPVTTEYVPTDGSLAANTAKDGIVGPQWRVKYTTVGTYAATQMTVSIQIAPMATTTSP